MLVEAIIFVCVVGILGMLLLPKGTSADTHVYIQRAVPSPAGYEEGVTRFTKFVNETLSYPVSVAQIRLYYECFTGRIEDVQFHLTSGAKLDVYCVAFACYNDNLALLKWLLDDKKCEYDDRVLNFLGLDREWNGRMLDRKAAIERFAQAFHYCRHIVGLRYYDDKNHVHDFTAALEGTVASLKDTVSNPKPAICSLDPFILRN